MAIMEKKDMFRIFVAMVGTTAVIWIILDTGFFLMAVVEQLFHRFGTALTMKRRFMYSLVAWSFVAQVSIWASLASAILIQLMVHKNCRQRLRDFIGECSAELADVFDNWVEITFDECNGKWVQSGDFKDIDAYVRYASIKQFTSSKRVEECAKTNCLRWFLAEDGETEDVFDGVRVLWYSGTQINHERRSRSRSRRRCYTLTFRERHWDLITGHYVNYVKREGKALIAANRWMKIYTNHDGVWDDVPFKHPATFKTLAMEAEKKKEIMDDLIAFSKKEDYYRRTGRAWKRGYLLSGPPGTGKSTMIAAIANLLRYDVYNLDLSEVANDTALKKLLMDTSSKSMVVIEDIDCALDPEKGTTVTLSGLLHFVDGLWSACGGGERLVVFTTTHVEKLDPRLIRKGRMDKHIHLSYCTFEAFKVLARNYLNLDSHPLFPKISELLEEVVDMTPADVAEHLTAMAVVKDAGFCLESLVSVLADKKLLAAKGTESLMNTQTKSLNGLSDWLEL